MYRMCIHMEFYTQGSSLVEYAYTQGSSSVQSIYLIIQIVHTFHFHTMLLPYLKLYFFPFQFYGLDFEVNT